MPHAPETFVHLHNHTEFSLLDGASRIHAMVERAAELDMPGLALTDHGVMYGAIHFYKACKQRGIKPILGFEAYVAPRGRTDREARMDRDPYHLTMLAADDEGYRNLMALCTIGQKEGLYYKPRIDREVLARHSKGLIVLSGCLGGEVATKITQDDVEAARETVATYRDIFGPDRYLLEVQRHDIDSQERVNQTLVGFSKEFGLRLAATNDLHYVHRHDAEPHDVLLCLQTGANFEDPKRWRFESDAFYLKTAAEMAQVFHDLPQALASTLEVFEQVHVDIDMGRSLLPPFEIPAGLTHDQYLRQKVEAGLRWRYGDDPPRAARERMDVELDVIRQTGYASYFLIVADFYEFARGQEIVTGPGRGSAAGSLVAYSLGITNLDPIEHGLLFERFLNKDRVSMPDIDCDFSVEGRERVIRYVSEKYGADRVAQIITFTTMASKAAIRDVGRVLEVPLKETDRLSKLVPVHQGRSKSLEDTIKEVPEFRDAYEAPPQQGPDGRPYHLRRLIDVAKTLEGVSRNVSVHAAGVVIAPDRLERFAPTQWGPRSAVVAGGDDGGRQVITQYDMKAVAEIGLLKMDFLGLQNLDIISTCLRLVRRQRGVEIDLLKLGFDDRATYELISNADTHGVFQLEGSGMRRMLQEMKPQSFADVTAAVALFRPGPMMNIPAYIARKQGREPIEYMHPRLEPILKDSYGVMIYQEQVMMAARELAGFTLSEADILRAAMGKKDAAKMAQQREKFVAGCVATGVGQKMGEELFDAIARFASYGFNRSHAAAYAMISYQTAYLKANYPVEYMTSLLTHMQGSADKVAAAIVDAKKRGLEVLPPDVNESRADFSIVDGGIRFGLAAIKNVGRGAVEQIVQERDERGPFRSLDDFCERMAGVQDVNARALDSLVRSGAADVFGERNQLMVTLDKARQRAEQARRDRESGQISLFGLVEEPEPSAADYGVPQVPPMPPEERLRSEKELLGLYLSDHPLNRIEAELAAVTDTQLIELTSELVGREVRIGGLVRAWRRVVTRKGQIMAYAEVEDLTGVVEVTFFPRAYDDFRRFMEEPDAVVIIQGKVDTARGGGGGRSAPQQSYDEELEAEEEEPEAVTLIADAVWAWSDRADIEPLERQRLVHVEVPECGPDAVDELATLLSRHAGGDDVLLHFRVNGNQVTVQVGDRFRVTAGMALKSALDAHFGREVTRMETVRPRAQANGNGNGNGRGGARNGNGRPR
jgi:DNA polymerase-3 subunit alpha